LEGAKSEESGKGGTRNSGTRVGLIALIHVLLVSLAMIIIADFGPQMTEEGFMAFISVLLLWVVFGTYWLATRDVRKDLGEKTPRGVVVLLIASGVAVVGAGFAILFGMIALLPLEARSPHLFFLFLGLFVVGIGFVVAGMAANASPSLGLDLRVPEGLLNSLRQIEPDKSFETEKFHVFRKSGIYILLQKSSWGVHFIRLFKQTPVSTKKVDAPYLGWWRNLARSFKEEAYGLRLAKVRRKFTIPIEIVKLGGRTDTKYVSGPGILYYVPLYPLQWNRMDFIGEPSYFKLDTPTIIKILNELSEEKA
jgi:hypothetical protein